MKRILLFTLILLSGCSYVRHAARQAHFAAEQWTEPRQHVYKHMVSRETFFVFGQIVGGSAGGAHPMAVVALSDELQKNEVVDVNHTSQMDSYYGLNLPEGRFQLVVVRDSDGNGLYEPSEIVGYREIAVGGTNEPNRVMGGVDLRQNGRPKLDHLVFKVPVKESPPTAPSLFYPNGSIRSLDDSLFSAENAEIGLYEPAAFLERAPMMFYALEEDQGFKVPVVFVHGIGGSPRDFEAILAKLDRRIYRPWFFYYPSGRSLSQLGEMFYDLFLSGDVIPLGEMPMVVVAHSMGGLVAREAMNYYVGRSKENHVAALITLASPLGGHPAAANGANAPMALPSWRDLSPASPFVRHLYRKKLPATTAYHLLYAYRNTNTLKLGANSDGVVPLASQLTPPAQNEATSQRGFDDTHTGILRNPAAIETVMEKISRIRPNLTEGQLSEFSRGGYEVTLAPNYSGMERYAIRYAGGYLDALAAGRLEATNEYERHFVKVTKGEASPSQPFESGWLKFCRDFPNRAGLPVSPVLPPPLHGQPLSN